MSVLVDMDAELARMDREAKAARQNPPVVTVAGMTLQQLGETIDRVRRDYADDPLHPSNWPSVLVPEEVMQLPVAPERRQLDLYVMTDCGGFAGPDGAEYFAWLSEAP